MGAGLSVLDGVDPNPDNFVCAGIIHTSSHQIGCLIRLEPNKQALVRIFTCLSVFSALFAVKQASYIKPNAVVVVDYISTLQ